jgi:CrcB protein
MKALLLVAGGGAAGAAARYLVYVATAHLLCTGFPYATLIVNIVGSFAMGLLAEVLALVWAASTDVRLFLAVGFLGAFTTFSTFSLDFSVVYKRGDLFLAFVYVAASVIFSIGALFAGLWVARRLTMAVAAT